jgi:arylsulfatase A-like enzyme
MRRRGFTAVAEAAVLDLPSIDHVIADDLGSNDVGGHGSDIKTPRIDFLARESAF